MHAYRGPGNDLEADRLGDGIAHNLKADFWSWFDAEARPKLGQRADTFAAIFRHLDKLNRYVRIVETGCMRPHGEFASGENWAGDGCSTLLFDRYVTLRPKGGVVYTCDIDHEAASMCEKIVSRRVHVMVGDSIECLSRLSGFVADLLYLDSFDLDTSRPLASEVHHINELWTAMPMIGPDTLVVVDDSPITMNDFGDITVGGKGALVARHAVEVGADLKFAHYQIGWTGMHRRDTPLEVLRSDDDLKVLAERARAHIDAKQDLKAADLYRLILKLVPNAVTPLQRVAVGDACWFFGRTAVMNGRLGLALDWYTRALYAVPQEVGFRLELATRILQPMRNFLGAKKEALIAVRVEPNNKDAWRILGGFEVELGNLEAAIEAYSKQMELAPDDPQAMLDMISVLLDVPDYEAATRLGRRVIEETNEKGEGYHCLAFVAAREGRHEEAVELYNKAFELGVQQEATVHWNRSMSLHALGRYREGWHDHEWRDRERTQMALYMPLIRFTKPMWKREPPPARIHIHAEAGYGDNLCCARYLKMIVDRGYDVTYEAYGDMVGLMQRSFPSVKVVPQALDYPGALGIKEFDYHQPIGGLPWVFETEVDTVPWFGPYLVPDPDLVAKYREKVEASPWPLKVGFCWSAGIREGLWIAKYGARKSMRFKDMFQLMRTDRYTAFSLQIGPERSECKDFVPSYIWDILPEEPTWDDTAALVANLDLVVTVDTAVAHLAGAMGKPVWLMNSAEPGSWHWMAERPGSPWNERSPWYPSVKIYRQRKVCEWDEVVARVAADLAELR